MTDILSDLNDQQRQAVVHPDGPAVVLAGAGSGKTRVLTTRVAWLIAEKNLAPESVLLVTFTNKAAQEMSGRVEKLTGHRLPFAGTFHRICALLLRQHGHLIGLNNNYTIYDTQDQDALIKQIYKEHDFDKKRYHPNAVKALISQAKSNLKTYQQLDEAASDSFEEHVARVYKLYQLALTKQQAVDFDDLLVKLVDLFRTQPRILQQYQQQLTNILVDEYQDTNKTQYVLTKLLAQQHHQLYVVGDFSQSIYAWRGADYRNLEYLYKDFDVTEYRLEQNYRSTQTILDAATQVISQNTSHPILQLWTHNSHSEPLQVIEARDGEEEALLVLNEIKNRLHQYDYRDVAILYRTNAQSRPFEEACVRLGIPYQLVGGFKFYERKEIKDALAYLRVWQNPADEVSALRAAKLGKRRYQDFDDWAQQHREDQLTPYQALETILRVTKFVEQFDEADPQDVARLENVQELLNVASQFHDVPQFLENVALVQDDRLADVEGEEKGGLTLMSLHSAKGLEFPVVFMVGMEEGLLPHSRSQLDPNQLEEERRLCYVGITRAQEKLYFSYARQRWQYGSRAYSLRSRFLQEIDPTLLVLPASPAGGPASAQGTPTTPSGRRLVIDDDTLEAVIRGEMEIDAFLDS